jgi:hypothetical protein
LSVFRRVSVPPLFLGANSFRIQAVTFAHGALLSIHFWLSQTRTKNRRGISITYR